jgi:hypothetical protein
VIFREQDGKASYLGPLVAYLKGPGRNRDGSAKPPNNRAQFLGGSGFGVPISTDPEGEARALRMMKANNASIMQAPDKNGRPNTPIEKHTLHVTMSWDRGQTPSNEEMLRAADMMADTIQMPENGYMRMVYRHSDTDHPHAHVVFSTRHTQTGRAAPSFQRRYRGWHFSVNYDRDCRDRHGIPIPDTLQWREDRAQAAKRGDHEAQRKLLFKEGISELDGRPTVNNAVVKATAVRQAAAFAGKFEADNAAYEASWAEHNKLLKLRYADKAPVAAYTTAAIYRHESQIIGIAKKLAARTGFNVDPNTIDEVSREMTLSKEQDAELRWSTRGGAFTMTTGRAGAGKSHSNRAFRKVMEKNGYTVRGTSTSNNVVQQMQRDGYQAATLWQVIHQIEAYERAAKRHEARIASGKIPKKPAPTCPWNERTVWAVEEATQVSDPDLLRFLKKAEKYNCMVKIVQGKKQNQAVERCGTLDVLDSKLGSAELTENWRNPKEAPIWNRMYQGKQRDWQKVVEEFDKLGSLKFDKSKDASMAHAVADYMADFRAKPDMPRQGVAMRNVENKKLNEMVQAAMLAEGHLGEGYMLHTKHGPLQVHVGDRVRLTQSALDPTLKRKGATAGSYGKVDAITPREDGGYDVVFSPDRRRNEQPRKLTLPFGGGEGQMTGIRHGYFSTSWSVQGRDTGRTFAVQDPMNARSSTYVGASRHQKYGGLSYYINESETPDKKTLAKQWASGDGKKCGHNFYLDEEERAKLKAMPYEKPEPPSFPGRTPGQTPPRQPPPRPSPPTPAPPRPPPPPPTPAAPTPAPPAASAPPTPHRPSPAPAPRPPQPSPAQAGMSSPRSSATPKQNGETLAGVSPLTTSVISSSAVEWPSYSRPRGAPQAMRLSEPVPLRDPPPQTMRDPPPVTLREPSARPQQTPPRSPPPPPPPPPRPTAPAPADRQNRNIFEGATPPPPSRSGPERGLHR